MLRRNCDLAVKLFAAAALLAVLGVGLVIAQGSDDDDDRPPIIVRNGSLIFDGGEGANTRTFAKDAILGEWKPRQDDAKGVRTLEVKFAAVPSPAPACGAATMSGEEVLIEYRPNAAANAATVMRVHLRRKHLIGKKEPKIDPNGKPLKLLEHTSITPTPPMLVYEDDRGITPVPPLLGGWISKVTVDATSCEFVQPTSEAARLAFRVRIQPKKKT